MSKLGIAIKVTKEGAGQPLVINKGEWINRVVDVRDTLKMISGLDDFNKIAQFISFTENGCLLTLVRRISGRLNDNVSAWIFIPNTANISGDDVVFVVEGAKSIILGSKVESDSLENLVGKDYPNKQVVGNYVPSAKEGYAYREVGFYPLEDIFGTGRYQEYYSQFKTVFIIDTTSGIDIVDRNGVTDLSTRPIEDLCILMPPSINDIINVFGNNHVQILFQENRKVFQCPTLLRVGSTIALFAYREGFEPIKFDVKCINNEQQCEFPIQRSTWQKRISRNIFIVTDSTGHVIKNCIVKVAEKPISNEIVLTEDESKDISISVQADGYESKRIHVNLLSSKTINISLTRQEHIIEENIILSNGDKGHLSISTRSNFSRYDLPLSGYKRNDEGTLEFDSWILLKNKLIGIVYGVLSLLLCVMICGAVEWVNLHDFEWKFGIPPLEIKKGESASKEGQKKSEFEEQQGVVAEEQAGLVNKDDSTAAINYLDENNVWNKDEMENILCLKGLFDDMNNFALEKIKHDWSKKLSGSKNFTQVVNAVTNNLEKKQKYNEKSDFKITFTNYIKRLGRNPTPSTPIDESVSSDGQLTNGGL